MNQSEFRDHVIDKIRSHLFTSIETWLPSVKRSGGSNYKACNPLRGDKNPDSMCIYPDGRAYDFAANQPLDTIDLWAAVNSMSNGDAIRYHAERLGLNSGPAVRTGATRLDRPVKVVEVKRIEANVAREAYPLQAFTHPKHGRPSAVYTYKNAKGQLIGYTCRFDLGEGRKEVLPFTWTDVKNKVPTGNFGWHWSAAGWNGMAPVYGAEKIQRDPAALVLIVEGEKTADAAQILFPECLVISWAVGTGKARKADWSILAGRQVFIWPDADQKHNKESGLLIPPEDQPGMKAALTIAKALKDVTPRTGIVIPPADVKDGWDLADAAEEGWSSGRAMEYLIRSVRSLDELEEEFQPKKSHLSLVGETEPKPSEPSAKSGMRAVGETPVEIARKVLGFLRGEIEAPELEAFRERLDESSFNADVLASAIRTINRYQYTKEIVLRDALVHLGLEPSSARSQGGGGKRKTDPLGTGEILSFIRDTLGYGIMRNEVLGCLELDGKPLDEPTLDAILEACRMAAPELGKELANERIVMRVLNQAPSYHPFKSYLENSKERFLAWQRENPGMSPIDSIVSHIHFPGDAERQWFLEAFGKWAQGHVSRVFYGWQNPVLVLQGAQGIGKSTFAAALARNLPRRYFTDEGISPYNKDCIINMAETFLWEIGEIGGTTGNTDVNMLKSFLTKPVINIRRPYARMVSTLSPMASFIGSTNDEMFLHDMTGNRRFLCAKVESFDRSWFNGGFDPDLFWGWAMVEAEKCGFRPEFSEELKVKSESINESFRVENPMESSIEDILEPDEGAFVTYEELKGRLYGRGVNDINTNCKRWQLVVNVVIRLGGRRMKGRTEKGVRTGFRGVRLINP